jgi:predicted exporter
MASPLSANARYVLLVLMILLSAWLAAWSLPKITLQNHLTAFFPAPQTAEQALLQSTLKEALSQDQRQQPLMLALRLPNPADTAALLQAGNQLKALLQADTSVAKVENQPPTLLAAQTDGLLRYRYLLASADFSESALQAALQTLWQAWQLGIVPDKTQALADPTQQWLRYIGQMQSQTQIAVHDGYWLAEDEQGAAALLLVNLQADEQAAAHFWAALQRIQAQQPQWRIKASSPTLIAWQARQTIQTSIQQLSVLASVMVLLFLAWRLRKPLWVALSFVPLAIGSLLAVLAVQWLFGFVEALALALGVVLIGVAVDYPIHAFSARRDGPAAEKRAWPLIRLGALTTAAGFVTLFVLDIDGLRQMAVFAISGILTAVGVTRALLWVLPSTSAVEMVGQTAQTTTRTGSYGHWLLLAGLFLAAWPLSQKWLWQDDLASLSPVPQSLLQQDGELRRHFQQAEAGQFMLVSAPDVETLLQRQETLLPGLLSLQQQGLIAGKTMLADLLPSQTLQRKRQDALPAEAVLQPTLLVAAQQAGTPFQAKHFAGFIAEVEQSKRLPLLDLKGFEALADQLLTQQSAGVVGKILLRQVADKDSVRTWAHAQGLVWFDQREFVAQSVSVLRTQLLQVLGAFLVVMLLVLWAVKAQSLSWKRAFTPACSLLMPVVLGLVFTYAVLLALGQVLTAFHLLASLLLIGIGLDYSLFAQGARNDKQPEYLRSVHAALLTTLLSFGFLLLTPIPILVAIGQVMVVGVLSIYVSARLYFKV